MKTIWLVKPSDPHLAHVWYEWCVIILSTTDLAVNITSLCFRAAYILGIGKSHLGGGKKELWDFSPSYRSIIRGRHCTTNRNQDKLRLYSSAEVGPSGSLTECIFSTWDSTTPRINNYALHARGWGSWAVQPVLGSKHVRYEQDLTPLSQLCLNCSAVVSISKGLPNKCPAWPPAGTLGTPKPDQKCNTTSRLLKCLPQPFLILTSAFYLFHHLQP